MRYVTHVKLKQLLTTFNLVGRTSRHDEQFRRGGGIGPAEYRSPCGQKTRRGPSPPEQSGFLFLINVSVSAALN